MYKFTLYRTSVIVLTPPPLHTHIHSIVKLCRKGVSQTKIRLVHCSNYTQSRMFWSLYIYISRLVHCYNYIVGHVLEPIHLHSASGSLLQLYVNYITISCFGACKFAFRGTQCRTDVSETTRDDEQGDLFYSAAGQVHILRDKSLFCGTSPCSAVQVPILRDKSLFCGTSPYSAGQVPQTLMDFIQMYNDHDRAKSRKKKLLCCWLFISFLAT